MYNIRVLNELDTDEFEVLYENYQETIDDCIADGVNQIGELHEYNNNQLIIEIYYHGTLVLTIDPEGV